MKFEGGIESFAPQFDIRESRDEAPRTHKKLVASFGGVTFELTTNLINYTHENDLKMVDNISDKANDELDRLRTQAMTALEKHLESAKWDDYSENFK